MNLLRRPDVRYPIILAVLALALWAPRLRGPIDLRYDAGVYYILGTSLAEGKGYRLLNEPGEISALQYPPLLPAIVAVEQKLLGTSDPAVVGQWLRWTYLAFFLVYSLGSYRLARYVLGPGHAFLAALICTMSCDMMYLSDLLQAELPFAAVTVLFALSAKSLSDGKESAGAGRFILTALLGTAAFLIRSAGVAVLAAWVGEAVLRRQWKQVALRCVLAAVPFFAWQAWVAHVRGGPEYAQPTYAYQRAPYQYYNVSYVENLLLIDSFKPELGRASNGQIVKRVLKNSLAMPACLGEAASLSKSFGQWAISLANKKLGRPANRPFVPWRTPVAWTLLVGTLVIAGVVLLVIRRRWFVPLYVCATLFLICLTPWPQQFQRYLAPVAPFLVVSLLVALAAAWDYVAAHRDERVRTIGKGSIAALLALIPLFQLAGNVVVFSIRHSPMEPGGTKFFYIADDWVYWSQAVKWIDGHSAKDDVVATSAPHLLYLDTGRRSVLPPMESDTGMAMRMMDSVPVRYLIVGTFRFLDIDPRYADPVVREHANAWKLVYTADDGETRVYERVR